MSWSQISPSKHPPVDKRGVGASSQSSCITEESAKTSTDPSSKSRAAQRRHRVLFSRTLFSPQSNDEVELTAAAWLRGKSPIESNSASKAPAGESRAKHGTWTVFPHRAAFTLYSS